MQLETYSPNNNKNSIVYQLLPFVKPFAFSWFNLQAQKRKYLKKNDSDMPLADIKTIKEGLKATSPSVKKTWAERLLTKLMKDVVTESRDDFARCVTTKNSNTSCVSSQPDHLGKMRRIDCFKQADKIWRLDLVAVILFKGIPLENTDSERLERVESCSDILCINPYHVLITCKELDLYISYHIKKSTILDGRSCANNNQDVVLTSVYSTSELLEEGDVNDEKDTKEGAFDISKLQLVRHEETTNCPDNHQQLVDTQQTIPEGFKQLIHPNFEHVKHLFSKKLPRLVVSLQPQPLQDQGKDSEEEIRSLPKQAPKSEICASSENDTLLQRLHPQALKQVLENMSSPKLLKANKEMKPKALQVSSESQNVISIKENQGNVQQPLYRHVQIFNPTHVATGMYFPFSNERMNFSQVNAPSSLASTLTSILPPSSSLTLPGPLFVLQPITSETVFIPPNSGITMSLTPLTSSSPLPKPQPPTGFQPYSEEQLASYNHMPSQLSSSSSSSASSSFNLDQFIDFGQQPQTSVLSPLSPHSSVAMVTMTTPISSLMFTSTLYSDGDTNSNKRSRTNHEAVSPTLKVKRQRTSMTEISDATPYSSSRQNLFPESYTADINLSKIPSENFLRSDRQEGFKVFQSSSDSELTLTNKPHLFNAGHKSQKCVFSFGQPQDASSLEILKGDSPSSDRGSPMLLPHVFTKELLLPTQNVPKPVAIFSVGDHLAPVPLTSNEASNICTQEDNENNNEGRLRMSITSDDEDDADNDKESNLAFNGNRTLQASPFTIIPISGSNNTQMMVGYPSNMVADGNNSNPVFCCLNAGGLLSPTPFNPSSSPAITPKTTPCSTPIPPRWCTPFIFEGENESYPALMVNVINLEEICFSNESSGGSSDRRSQTTSTLNLLSIGQRLSQDENNNVDDSEDDGGGLNTADGNSLFEKSQQ